MMREASTEIFCQSLEFVGAQVPLSTEDYQHLISLQRDVLADLAVSDNMQAVLDSVCRLTEAMLPNAVASVMLLDPATGLMNVRAAPSIPSIGHQALANLKPGLTGGSCGNAVFQNAPQYVSDTKQDPRWQDLRHIAYDFNLCACWSMPIRDQQGKAIGTFALSSFEHRSPSDFHKQLLEVCAFIVNIVLQREEHERADDENQEKLVTLAYFDQLTELPNRQRLQLDLSSKTPSACAVINIDSFKELNDFFGVSVGDEILQKVAHWLRNNYAFSYRIGGDEFAILLFEAIDEVEMTRCLEKLTQGLAKEVFVVDGEAINVSVTVGAALQGDRLLNRADIALHKAKVQRVQVALYEESDHVEDRYRNNIEMATRIRKAIEAERIVAYYQPIVNLASGRIEKYETLMRMIDEQGRLISPAEVIPIAKKTKIYPLLTQIIVRAACRTFAHRKEAFSVNLSIEDIANSLTVAEIIHVLTETNTASRITFELIESEGVDNYEVVADFISRVKQLGAKIAIDDFGTGYSNFEHLLRLNVDYIKIDGSLIQGIVDNPRHAVIVETIVNFANRIQARTVAEFVSDKALFDKVSALGVTCVQGYYLGKPEALSD